MTPNGLIANLTGPYGKRHDAVIFRESNLAHDLSRHMNFPNGKNGKVSPTRHIFHDLYSDQFSFVISIFLFFIFFPFFDKGSSPRSLEETGFSCRNLRRNQIYMHKVKLLKIDINVYNV